MTYVEGPLWNCSVLVLKDLSIGGATKSRASDLL